ncbi:MAG: hypothetical protein JSV21_01835 [Nitrospirota bacterium]|nr:MAG: hypothetical protein JSV21_01835 [Nitrospirota bacterium]
MDDERTKLHGGKGEEKHPAAEKIKTIGWGAFFIWLGIAFLLNVPLGVKLIGVGVVALGVQVARKAYNLILEGFWIGIGVIFLAAGIWELMDISLPLLPLILLAVGVIFILRVYFGDKSGRGKGK